jgi:DNA-binding transcriptional LysR family regulator
MNKFQAIKTFLRVAECQGFSAAADVLGISASAVTKNVNRLEQDLRVQLFNRSTRHIMLTDLGKVYYDQCKEVMCMLDDADSALRRSNASLMGSVRIVMPVSFGRVTFIPALPAFYEAFPDIHLDIHFNDGFVDLIQERFDIAVMAREQPDSSLIRKQLITGPMLTVAAPSYLEKWGTPQTPDDLIKHNCIVGRFGPNWLFRMGDNKPKNISVPGNISLQSGDAVREAATAGIGIAQSTHWLFRRDLSQGNVVSVLEDYACDAIPVAALYHSKENMSRRVQEVLHFLVEITKKDPDAL